MFSVKLRRLHITLEVQNSLKMSKAKKKGFIIWNNMFYIYLLKKNKTNKATQFFDLKERTEQLWRVKKVSQTKLCLLVKAGKW